MHVVILWNNNNQLFTHRVHHKYIQIPYRTMKAVAIHHLKNVFTPAADTTWTLDSFCAMTWLENTMGPWLPRFISLHEFLAPFQKLINLSNTQIKTINRTGRLGPSKKPLRLPMVSDQFLVGRRADRAIWQIDLEIFPFHVEFIGRQWPYEKSIGQPKIPIWQNNAVYGFTLYDLFVIVYPRSMLVCQINLFPHQTTFYVHHPPSELY